MYERWELFFEPLLELKETILIFFLTIKTRKLQVKRNTVLP